MECKSCSTKIVKVLNLKKEEILKYLSDEKHNVIFSRKPIRKLSELQSGEPVLVYYREYSEIFGDESFGNKIQLRRIEDVKRKDLKLCGLQQSFNLKEKNPTVVYEEMGQKLAYTLIPMDVVYLSIIEEYLEKLGDGYTGTKLNNKLNKSEILSDSIAKFEKEKSLEERVKEIFNSSIEDFPF